MSIRKSSLSAARVLAAASVPVLSASMASAAALPSVLLDLRVHDTGGKEVTLTNAGDSVLLDLYAVVTGLNSNPSDDRVTSGLGMFQSSKGGLLGDLTGLRPPSPYDATFATGLAKDLDSDGDLDIGGAQSLETYQFRAVPPVPAQPAGGSFVGQVRFTLRTPADAATDVNYRVRTGPSNLNTVFDGAATPIFADPTKMTLSYAAPVTIRGSSGGGSLAEISGSFANLSIDTSKRIPNGQTLGVTQRLDIVSGGRLDATGGTLRIGGTGAAGQLNVAGGKLELFSLDLSDGSAAVVESGTFASTAGSFATGAQIGRQGAGSLTIRGGTTTFNGDLQVGIRGTLAVTGGLIDTWRTTLGGRAEQAGGTYRSGALRIGGPSAEEPAEFRLTDGTLDIGLLQFAGHGVVTQTGGRLSIGGTSIVSPAPGEQTTQVALAGGTASFERLYVAVTNGTVPAGTGRTGGVVQSGGNVSVGQLSIHEIGTYDLVGGSLAVTGGIALDGTINFAGAAVPVSFGPSVFADFTTGRLLNASAATFTAAAGSLLSFADQAQLASVGTVKSHGLIHVAGQPLEVPQDKSIGGNGTIQGNVTNHGTIAPGNSPGALVVNGTYAQADGAALSMEIAGAGSDQFDTLTISGQAAIDGFLNVSLLDGFVPSAAQSFTILTASGLSGTFDNVSGGRVEFPGGRFDVAYSPTAVMLSNFAAVPEPGSLAVVGIGVLAVLRRRRAACAS